MYEEDREQRKEKKGGNKNCPATRIKKKNVVTKKYTTSPKRVDIAKDNVGPVGIRQRSRLSTPMDERSRCHVHVWIIVLLVTENSHSPVRIFLFLSNFQFLCALVVDTLLCSHHNDRENLMLTPSSFISISILLFSHQAAAKASKGVKRSSAFDIAASIEVAKRENAPLSAHGNRRTTRSQLKRQTQQMNTNTNNNNNTVLRNSENDLNVKANTSSKIVRDSSTSSSGEEEQGYGGVARKTRTTNTNLNDKFEDAVESPQSSSQLYVRESRDDGVSTKTIDTDPWAVPESEHELQTASGVMKRTHSPSVRSAGIASAQQSLHSMHQNENISPAKIRNTWSPKTKTTPTKQTSAVPRPVSPYAHVKNQDGTHHHNKQQQQQQQQNRQSTKVIVKKPQHHQKINREHLSNESYLGPWRGEERARLLAYEACLQSCLEGSLGSQAAQSKVDMAVRFLTDRCRELRVGFGLETVLVGTRPQNEYLPSHQQVTNETTNDSGEHNGRAGSGGVNVASKSGNDVSALGGAGGTKWAALNIDVLSVDITERGLKKYSKGWDPRMSMNTNDLRGRKVKIQTTGGPGSADSVADFMLENLYKNGGASTTQKPSNEDGNKTMKNFNESMSMPRTLDKSAPSSSTVSKIKRLPLGPGDEKLIVEVFIRSGKTARAQASLEDVYEWCRANGEIELPLYVNATVKDKENDGAMKNITYNKGNIKLSVNFEVAVGVGASSAPPGSDPGFFGKNSSKIGVQLSTSGAYDIALAAALRSLHFTRRRLQLHGHWAWLLEELRCNNNVSESYASLRYVQHLLAVATPTADCLSLICQHLKLPLRKEAEGTLSGMELQILNGHVRGGVLSLVCVCFQNYKSLDESEFRGIMDANSTPHEIPAPALDVSLELFRMLKRNETNDQVFEILASNLSSAARTCYKRNKAVILGDAQMLAMQDPETNSTLYQLIGTLCQNILKELEVDHVVQDSCLMPIGFSLPLVSSDIYCAELTSTVSHALKNTPPNAPPSNEVLGCIDYCCEVESASLREEGESPSVPARFDARGLFQLHIDRWIESARLRLEAGCSTALNNKGVSEAAMDDIYAEMHIALEGFEKIVTRWPDVGLPLEEILVGAERLVLLRIYETVEHLQLGRDFRDAVSETTAQMNGHKKNATNYKSSMRGIASSKSSRTATKMENFMSMAKDAKRALTTFGKATTSVAKVAKRTVTKTTQDLRRFATFERQPQGLPSELAAALSAVKAMEMLRPELCQRLSKWVEAGHGCDEEFGRRMVEVLGELRAQYAGYMRRAVTGVAASGPSLRLALRDARPDAHIDAVLDPVLKYVDDISSMLVRALSHRRAYVGVLRGLWDSLGSEALLFYEEDLKQRSSWTRRVLAAGAVERIGENFRSMIRNQLEQEVKEKDLEAPAPIAKLNELNSSSANDGSINVY